MNRVVKFIGMTLGVISMFGGMVSILGAFIIVGAEKNEIVNAMAIGGIFVFAVGLFLWFITDNDDEVVEDFEG